MNIDERIEALRLNIESLRSSMSELYASTARDNEILRESVRATRDGGKRRREHSCVGAHR
jgi:hypothetical protein